MECPLRFKDGDTDDWFRFRCIKSTDQIPKEGRLGNCELKLLPKRINPLDADLSNQLDLGYLHGRNDCINKVLGLPE